MSEEQRKNYIKWHEENEKYMLELITKMTNKRVE